MILTWVNHLYTPKKSIVLLLMILKNLALRLTQFPFLTSMRCDGKGESERKATLHHIKVSYMDQYTSMNHTKSEEQCWPIGAM